MGKILAEKIGKLWRDAGLSSQRELARVAEIPATTLNYYASGKYKKESLPAEIVKALEAPLIQRGIHRDRIWALTEISAPSHKVIANFGTVQVPLLGAVQAGQWGRALAFEAPDVVHIELPVISQKAHGYENTYLVEVAGESMNRKFLPGTLLECVHFLDYNGEITTGKFVICERKNRWGEHETTVKQLEVRPDGEHWLWPRSNEPEFQQPLRVPPHDEWNEDPDDEVRVVGVVIYVHGAPVP